jgi:hypothetical protein
MLGWITYKETTRSPRSDYLVDLASGDGLGHHMVDDIVVRAHVRGIDHMAGQKPDRDQQGIKLLLL